MDKKSFSSRLARFRAAVFSLGVAESELEAPTFTTVLKIIWNTLRVFPTERAGQIFGSAFLLLMLWGYHGNFELLKFVLPAWAGPGMAIGSRSQIIAGLPWDNELISFWGGALLLVGIPILLIKFVYGQELRVYGLGLPPKGRRKLALVTFLVLTVICIPAFLFATRDAGMRATYPFYRPFASIPQFLLYELTYLPFFIAIEFIFRGYLLFGLAAIRGPQQPTGKKGGLTQGEAFYFGKYALLIQMLSYTAWHLGKPIPELWGTVFWGIGAGVLAFTVRSIWPVVASHWLLNVLFDAIVIYGP